jgi:hypothetical protein
MPELYQTKIWQARLPVGWEARTLLFDAAFNHVFPGHSAFLLKKGCGIN